MRGTSDRISHQDYHIGQAYRKALEAGKKQLARDIYGANPTAKAEMDIQKKIYLDTHAQELLHA